MTALISSGVNDKPVFHSLLVEITKYLKNIWQPVIENVIILGFVMVDTSSK